MSSGGWFAQPFGPDGGITADGIRNQLGRPELSALTVLVRESAQNTWDARTAAVVDYGLDLRELSAAQHAQWKRELAWSPRGLGEGERQLVSFFRSGSARVLFVSDRGTVGLGGPTRADELTQGQRNWLSFVLNSGEKRDTDGGGGTYGYGKGCFFILSRARTIVIFTRFADEKGLLRSRLIGSAMLTQHEFSGVPYTGRHWWGRPQEAHCEPLLDDDAVRTAHLLGFPSFEGAETGTTIAVIDPDLTDPTVPDDESAQMSVPDAGRFLADAAVWNLWPLMMQDRSPRLRVSVSVNSSPLALLDETNDAALAHFAQAYRDLRAGRGEEAWAGSAREVVGRLSVGRTMGALIDSSAARELGLDGSPHHVCVMRRPDLVVRYVEGRPREVAELGYAGVFRARESLDDIYARSEPPTHDAWIDSQLAGREAMIIRSTHRRIAEACDAIAVVAGRGAQHVAESTAGVAYHLGGLLEGLAGGGADPFGDDEAFPGQDGSRDSGGGKSGTDSGSGGGSSGRIGGASVRAGGSTVIQEVLGRLLLQRPFKMRGKGEAVGSAVVVTGEGQAERERPAGAPEPRVLGWLVDGRMESGDALSFDFPEEREVMLCALPEPDVMVQLEARKIS